MPREGRESTSRLQECADGEGFWDTWREGRGRRQRFGGRGEQRCLPVTSRLGHLGRTRRLGLRDGRRHPGTRLPTASGRVLDFWESRGAVRAGKVPELGEQEAEGRLVIVVKYLCDLQWIIDKQQRKREINEKHTLVGIDRILKPWWALCMTDDPLCVLEDDSGAW